MMNTWREKERDMVLLLWVYDKEDISWEIICKER